VSGFPSSKSKSARPAMRLPELDASEGIPVMPPVKPLTLWYKDDPDDYPPRRLFLDLVKFLEDRLDRHGAHFDAKGSCRR